MGIARGTCLGASAVHVSVYVVADYLPASDEISPAAVSHWDSHARLSIQAGSVHTPV